MNAVLPLDGVDQQFEIQPDIGYSKELFEEVCRLNSDARVELTREGRIIIMAPTAIESDYQNGEVFNRLKNWTIKTKRGKAFGPTAGFYLPDGSNRSPDASWVSDERVSALSDAQKRKQAPLLPEFVIEVKSPSDRLKKLQEKCLQYLENGVSEAWLIHPDEKTVFVYRPGQETQELVGVSSVTASAGPVGFVLELTEIWAGLS